MNKTIRDEEYEALLAMISRFEGGASIYEISEALDITLSRRTLQRRLAYLVETGQLLSQGEKKARRYLLPSPVSLEKTIPKGEAYIPISEEAHAVKAFVREPRKQRPYIAYNRKLLDAYVPNKTAYLSEKMGAHLHGLTVDNDGERPAGTFAREIYNRLLMDLSWNSSRLEGNTYSLLETEKLINLGEASEGKDRIETKMILNHKAAIEFLINDIAYIGFNRYTLLNLHALLSDGLLVDPHASGRLRSIAVGIGGSSYRPLDVPQLIHECFDQILLTAAAISDPFEQSFFAMVHLPYLQPFEDVNKRVSRLAANIPLILNNLSPISFVEVPQRAYIDGIIGVYELNNTNLLQDVYLWAYERSCYRYRNVCNTLVEPDPFRLQYSHAASELVRKIVLEKQKQQTAFACIRTWAEAHVPKHDRVRFIEMVETELITLHEGRIALHRLRPPEFHGWRKGFI